jgi:hypothetical protein
VGKHCAILASHRAVYFTLKIFSLKNSDIKIGTGYAINPVKAAN